VERRRGGLGRIHTRRGRSRGWIAGWRTCSCVRSDQRGTWVVTRVVRKIGRVGEYHTILVFGCCCGDQTDVWKMNACGCAYTKPLESRQGYVLQVDSNTCTWNILAPLESRLLLPARSIVLKAVLFHNLGAALHTCCRQCCICSLTTIGTEAPGRDGKVYADAAAVGRCLSSPSL